MVGSERIFVSLSVGPVLRPIAAKWEEEEESLLAGKIGHGSEPLQTSFLHLPLAEERKPSCPELWSARGP